MDLSFLSENQNITVSLTSAQLHDFANQILSGARAIYETKEPPEQYLTVSKTAELLDVDPSTLWRWNKQKYLMPIEIGGKRRYRMTDVKKILGD